MALSACGGAGNDTTPSTPMPPTTPSVWARPNCNSVTDSGAVTFTSDFGQSYQPRNVPVSATAPQLTRGLLPIFGAPQTVIVTNEGSLMLSRDAGCSWSTVASISDDTLDFVDSGSDYAYGWNAQTGNVYHFRETTGLELRGQGVGALRGFGISRANESHLRAVDRLGVILESLDGGRHWTDIGQAPLPSNISFVGFAAFDPVDINHIFVTGARISFVTFDGGATWSESSGFNDEWADVNITFSSISPVDSNFIWASAFDLTVQSNFIPSGERGIFLSVDGGNSFTKEIDISANGAVELDNQPIFIASLFDQNLLLGVHTQIGQPCRTIFYRYDAASKILVTEQSEELPSIGGLANSPAGDDIIYVAVERRLLCTSGG